MTKNEATAAGKAAGAEHFALCMRSGLFTVTKDTKFDEAFASDVRVRTSAYMAMAHIKQSTPYFDAFAGAFTNAAREVWYDLPEVKMEMRRKAAVRWLDRAREDFEAARDKFIDRLGKSPFDALEWSEDMFQVTGRYQASLAVRAVLDSPEGGLDAAVEYATRMALQGARNPEHSTSPTSNVAKTYRNAGYAEFLEVSRWS